MHNLTWTCHVCGRERPDERISVESRQVMRGTVVFTENVRYCNDRAECIEKAKVYSHLTEGEKESQ